MNYQAQHDKIINTRLRLGEPKGYTEEHHIVPRAFGGSNDKENLVKLTAREHFVIHRLLARLYPETGMVHAAFKMACVNRKSKKVRITSRTYEVLRQAHALRVSLDKEASEKKSVGLKGRKQTQNHILARTTSRKNNGPWLTDEAKANMSKPRQKPNSRKGRKLTTEKEMLGHSKAVKTRQANGNYSWSDERKKAQSERLLKTPVKKPPLTEEQKQKLREEKTRLVTCPHCGKVGAMMIMPRWHFDNCKERYTGAEKA